MTTTWAVIRLYWDWDGDGDFSEPSENLSAYRLSTKCSRGCSGSPVLSEDTAGQLTCVLDNATGIFSKGNTGGTYYGYMVPGQLVKLTAQIGAGAEVTLFQGDLDDIELAPAPQTADTTATLTAKGVLGRPVGVDVSLASYADALSGSLVGAILNAASFPAGDRTIDAGLSTIGRYGLKSETAAAAEAMSALRDIEIAELGKIRESRDGKFIFESRAHRLSAPHTVSQATYTLDPAASIRAVSIFPIDTKSDVFAKFSAQARSTDLTDEQTLWQLSGSSVAIAAGATVSLTAKLADSYLSCSSWTTIDYEANTASDGSGTDCTTDVSIVQTRYGDGQDFSITNSGGVTAYLTMLRAYGIAIIEGDPIEVTDTVTGGIGKGTFPKTSSLITSVTEAQGWTAHAKALYGVLRQAVTIKLDANASAANFAEALRVDLSDRITVTAGAASRLYINADFWVERIEYEIDEQGRFDLVLRCAEIVTHVWGASYGDGGLGGNGSYAAVTVQPLHPPDDLKVYKFPVGTEISTGAIAWKYNDTIDAAEIRYKFVDGNPEYVDLSGETSILLAATFSGANYTIYKTAYDVGRCYFAYRFRNADGWSVWSDGNVEPTRVTDYSDAEDSSIADDGPPAGWTVTADVGLPANSVQVRASRPSIHGRRILFAMAQIKDISVDATWRELDDADVTLYDGSAVSHTLSGSKRFTRNSGSGFGTAQVGSMVLICRNQGSFTVDDVLMGYWVGNFEGDDPSTATWFELTGSITFAADVDYRIKIVTPPWEWTDEGYLGPSGWIGREFWAVVNADGSNGDMTSTEFVFPALDIGSALIANIRARVFFQTGWSASDDNTYSTTAPGTGEDGIESTVGAETTIDAALATGWIRVNFSGDGALAAFANARDRQEIKLILVNTSSAEIVITLASTFRSGRAFPTTPNALAPSESGLDILEGGEGAYFLTIPANSQGYLIAVHDGLQGKDDVISWEVPYTNAILSPTNNLIGVWELNGNADDSFVDARHGFLSSSPDDPDFTSGKIGQCLHIDGGNELMEVPDSTTPLTSFGVTNWTIGFWFKWDITGVLGNVSIHLFDGGPICVDIDCPGGTPTQFSLRIDADTVSINSVPATGVWHHCIASFDNGTGYLYLDSTLVASGAATVLYDQAFEFKLCPYAQGFEIWEEQIAVWKRTLTSGQRDTLWNGGAGLAFSAWPSDLLE
jgi:hypothetical protein